MQLATVRGLQEKFRKYSIANALVALSSRNRVYWMFSAEGRKFIIKFDIQGHYHVYTCLPSNDVWFPILSGGPNWHEAYYSRFDVKYINRVINCYARELGTYHSDYYEDEGYFERYYLIPVRLVTTDGTRLTEHIRMEEDETKPLQFTLSYYSYLYV